MMMFYLHNHVVFVGHSFILILFVFMYVCTFIGLSVYLAIICLLTWPSQSLKKHASEKLAAIVSGPEYPALLKQLIIQGLIKIEEPEVEVQVRAEDKTIVTKLVSNYVFTVNYIDCMLLVFIWEFVWCMFCLLCDSVYVNVNVLLVWLCWYYCVWWYNLILCLLLLQAIYLWHVCIVVCVL